MTCMASANREGVLGSERVCLCTEGFGNRMCILESVSDRVSSHITLNIMKQRFRELLRPS